MSFKKITKKEWIEKKRFEIIAAKIIHKWIRICTWDPAYKLARKLVLQRAYLNE